MGDRPRTIYMEGERAMAILNLYVPCYTLTFPGIQLAQEVASAPSRKKRARLSCSANGLRLGDIRRQANWGNDNKSILLEHDGVIKWKQFTRHWPFLRGIYRSPANSPQKCQWRGSLLFYLFFAWTDGWVNNTDVGDLRRHPTHYNVTVMTVFWCRPIYQHPSEWHLILKQSNTTSVFMISLWYIMRDKLAVQVCNKLLVGRFPL